MVWTHLKNINQNENLLQVGVKIKQYLKPPPSDQIMISAPNWKTLQQEVYSLYKLPAPCSHMIMPSWQVFFIFPPSWISLKYSRLKFPYSSPGCWVKPVPIAVPCIMMSRPLTQKILHVWKDSSNHWETPWRLSFLYLAEWSQFGYIAVIVTWLFHPPYEMAYFCKLEMLTISVLYPTYEPLV